MPVNKSRALIVTDHFNSSGVNCRRADLHDTRAFKDNLPSQITVTVEHYFKMVLRPGKTQNV